MKPKAKKPSAVPIALVFTGAALGAFLVLKKREVQEMQVNAEKLSDACAQSLPKLERRISSVWAG